MKLYNVPEFHPEQAREIAEFDETKFDSIAKFMDSMDEQTYDAFVDKNGNEINYHVAITMPYGLFKMYYSQSKAVPNSYNAENKTICVFVRNIPQYKSHVEFYNIIHK